MAELPFEMRATLSPSGSGMPTPGPNGGPGRFVLPVTVRLTLPPVDPSDGGIAPAGPGGGSSAASGRISPRPLPPPVFGAVRWPVPGRPRSG